FYTYRIGEEKKENAAKAPPPNQPRPGDRQRYVPPVNRGAPGGPGRGQGDAVDPALLREMYADGDVPPPRRRGVADEGDIYMRRRQDLYRRAYGDDYMRRRQL